jgi:hypothetical protein
MRRVDDKVIDTAMLESLALIAAANERSLVEELNLAVQAYVHEQMPSSCETGYPQQSYAKSVQPGDCVT